MKYIIYPLFLLMSISSFAQQDAAAEPYLDRIAKDLNPGHTILIEFNYLREDQQADTRIEGEGTLYLLGEKYKIDLGDVIIWFDGEVQYSMQLETEEVYISRPDPKDKVFMFSDPIRLLRSYKEEFKYMLMGDAVFNGIGTTEIQLNPKELDGPYALIKLFISNTDNKLKSISIRHKQGIIYTMDLTSMKKTADQGNDFFKFRQEDFKDTEFDIIELID